MKKSMLTRVIIGIALLLFTLLCYGQNKKTDTTIDSIQTLGLFFEDNDIVGGTNISKTLFRKLTSSNNPTGANSARTNAIKENCEQRIGMIRSTSGVCIILQGKTGNAAKNAFAEFKNKDKDEDAEINGKFIVVSYAISPDYTTKIKKVFFMLKSDENGNLHLK